MILPPCTVEFLVRLLSNFLLSSDRMRGVGAEDRGKRFGWCAGVGGGFDRRRLGDNNRIEISDSPEERKEDAPKLRYPPPSLFQHQDSTLSSLSRRTDAWSSAAQGARTTSLSRDCRLQRTLAKSNKLLPPRLAEAAPNMPWVASKMSPLVPLGSFNYSPISP